MTKTETRNIARRADDDMAFSASGVQDHERPVCRLADLYPRLLGRLNKGDTLVNSTKGKKERVGRMMMMHSNNREEITEAFAGDIIALAV